jgi:cysteine desulfurase
VIYLDAAATGPTRREVLEAMWPFLAGDFGNPSSSHALGVRASEALESARASIAQALNCRSSEIIFTSGGTEADNLAIKGIALANPRGRHIVTSPIEHEAVLESCDYLCRLHQFELTQVVVDRFGMVDLDSFAAALRDNTTLCSVMLANNEVGTIQPVAELARLAHARGIPFHTDAVQAAGALDLDTKGIGALFLRGRLQAEPVLHGGGQERGRRSGTENVAGAVGLARALELATADRKRRAEHLSTLRDELIRGVLTSIPGAILTGHPTRRLPNHASFVFPGTSGEAILLQLEQRGILCSSGSACAAGRDEPSHVLLALGFAPEVSQTAVRLTLSDAVTSAQIPDIIAAVQQACAAVRHGDRPPDRPSHPR